jgi:hypothetical protein
MLIVGATAGGMNHLKPGRDKQDSAHACFAIWRSSGRLSATSNCRKRGMAMIWKKFAVEDAAKDSSLIDTTLIIRQHQE